MREKFVPTGRLPSEAPSWLAQSLQRLYADIAKRFLDAGSKNVPATISTTVPSRAWVGECVELSGGVGFTINTGIFVKGDVFSVEVTDGTSVTITAGGGFTLRLAGTTSFGNRTLAGYSLVTFRFVSSTEAKVLGAGVT